MSASFRSLRRESDTVFYTVVPSPGIPRCCRKKRKQNKSPSATTVVDTRESWARKLEAMEAYTSQAHVLESLRGDPVGWYAREEWFHEEAKCFEVESESKGGQS